jgi:uncharacterized protein (TIGR00255 family)
VLLSMTGFGEAHDREGDLAVGVELRTINNRYFKLSVKCAEGYGLLETEIEQVVRTQIRRGTVQVNLRVDRTSAADDYLVNKAVVAGYRKQLQALAEPGRDAEPVSLETLLALPGAIIENPERLSDVEAQWPAIKKTLVAAMQNLSRMRADEGRAMAADLRNNCAVVQTELAEIELRSPLVVDAYRRRLHDRLQAALAEYQVTLNAGELIKEVAVFADRGDISEEIVRLRSHLEQFETFMQGEESPGRKLEFVTQEMFREINTIGSKANDAEISRHVIEIKTAVERIREMIQNIE